MLHLRNTVATSVAQGHVLVYTCLFTVVVLEACQEIAQSLL